MRKVRRRKSEPLKGWVIRGLKDTDNTMNNTINREENKAIIEFDAIPDELKGMDRWVLWKYETREEKSTKVPYDANKLKMASCDDPLTWTTFEEVKEISCQHSKFDGIGFVFTVEEFNLNR